MFNLPKDPNEAVFTTEIGMLLRSALAEATNGLMLDFSDKPSAFENHPDVDLHLFLQLGKVTAEIAVKCVRHAYPRDLKVAAWRLEECRIENKAQNLIPMVAAESLSPGAKEELRKRGIGYFERNGSLYLRWRQWLINIERPATPSTKKDAVSLFTGAREKVVHALLTRRHEWLTGEELARLAETSAYTCSVVMQELVRREWCESTGGGRTLRRKLTQPSQLLDAWAEHWQKRKEKRSRWYIFARNKDGLLSQLTDHFETRDFTLPWAFTGTAATNAWAQYLTAADTAEVIIPTGTAEMVAKTLDLEQAEKGFNVTLIERAPDSASLLFREEHSGNPAHLASPFIQYLDLLNGRGRNKELAQYVRQMLEI